MFNEMLWSFISVEEWHQPKGMEKNKKTEEEEKAEFHLIDDC